MARSEVWFQVGVRIFEKFEVLHIARVLDISLNECVGALMRLWSISITDFPEGKGVLSSGTLLFGNWSIAFCKMSAVLFAPIVCKD